MLLDPDQKKQCCGTQGDYYILYNTTDTFGICFSTFVWCAILYAAAVTLIVTVAGEMAIYNGCIILFLIAMALWSHIMTMTGDPGFVPPNAHPLPKDAETGLVMCGRCECYKPPYSHHDRVSKRCVSRMDHFCPWMNNAIGAKNQKNFFLFLIYTDLSSIYLYIVVVIHLIDCSSYSCDKYTEPWLDMIRFLIFLLLFAILFTSSMILNQSYGLAIGLGTIDRMKLRDDDPVDETPIPFEHVFGDWWPAYFLPLNPHYKDPEAVFHYRLEDTDYCPRTDKS